jgi:putative ABC transport system permease protein
VGSQLESAFADQELTIIGVVKDFHVESLQNDIKPYGFTYFGGEGAGRNTSVRVASNDFAGVLTLIEKEWLAISNGLDFEYEFFDRVFEERYLAERKMGQILTAFSGLAMLIACLGLFGLAAFVTTQRTKEIGIRKALGASGMRIMALLSTDFGKWVVLANLIAWPVAYMLMNTWLENFVYRTEIALWYFPVSLLFGLILALITISGKTISAAMANPVHALRYE